MKRSFRENSFAGKQRRLQNAQQVNCPIMILITSIGNCHKKPCIRDRFQMELYPFREDKSGVPSMQPIK